MHRLPPNIGRASHTTSRSIRTTTTRSPSTRTKPPTTQPRSPKSNARSRSRATITDSSSSRVSCNTSSAISATHARRCRLPND
jgi:hypothetical protein